jgi:hypothetical protein
MIAMPIPFTKQHTLICLCWSLIGCAYGIGGGLGGYALRVCGYGIPRRVLNFGPVPAEEPVGFLGTSRSTRQAGSLFSPVYGACREAVVGPAFTPGNGTPEKTAARFTGLAEWPA